MRGGHTLGRWSAQLALPCSQSGPSGECRLILKASVRLIDVSAEPVQGEGSQTLHPERLQRPVCSPSAPRAPRCPQQKPGPATERGWNVSYSPCRAKDPRRCTPKDCSGPFAMLACSNQRAKSQRRCRAPFSNPRLAWLTDAASLRNKPRTQNEQLPI